MRAFSALIFAVAFGVANAFSPALRPARWAVALKATPAELDAEIVADMKKLEKEAQERLDKKKSELEAALKN
eukprot:CAMPEP_0172583794 /NCGR_PEP_ID=MMETSP1068-20121228/3337_1 /TAXON_ID=35684 /ORGANISM="Pseudopedinella elastica, Strain CCMP716" /LENGTH=71 /DNA_ID=CAMNT_0013377709 /DNA_START=236 /DNA_END=451 /DNA_ORIENTATION=+